MSIQPKQPIRLIANYLGPVIKLDAPLSKNARNMIYARNGTGKSFLTRALRYLDLYGQQTDISDAAFNLVSEESKDGRGNFILSQGSTTFGSLLLDSNKSIAVATCYERIFHVFSEDFVNTELRQKDYDLDGNITSEITIDQDNIKTEELEREIETKKNEFAKSRSQLYNLLEKKKEEDLIGKASISRQLKDYREIIADDLIRMKVQPDAQGRSFRDVLTDLDAIKSIPAEPNYPLRQQVLVIDQDFFTSVNVLLSKITSPSTVSEEIKDLLESNPSFFETGLGMLGHEKDGGCPFCRQSIAHSATKERIENYISYFADAEGRHKTELRRVYGGIKSLRLMFNDRIRSMASELNKYEALRKLVPSQRAVLLPELGSTVSDINDCLEKYLKVIESKGRIPSLNVEIPENDILGLFKKINEYIEEYNIAFAKLSNAVQKSDNERKSLHREACKAFLNEFLNKNMILISTMHLLEDEVKLAQSNLETLKKSQISTSVKERVAETFELLIASFFGNKYSFDRSAFVLRRENKAMARGANRTLSDGEKTAIAFCYFLACAHKKVKQVSEYTKLYFVFDDPITSMSYDFIFSIAQALKNMSVDINGNFSFSANLAKGSVKPELLILTHSSYFYNICVTNMVVDNNSAFFLYRDGGAHKLVNRFKYVAPFEDYLKEIYEVHKGREATNSTGNAVRCVLEAIGRFCRPDKAKSLSDFIKYLAGEDGLPIKSILINNLSHGTYYEEIPSPEELQEACSEAILIVERYAPGQLELVRQVTSEE